MSGECEICGEHTLECTCLIRMFETFCKKRILTVQILKNLKELISILESFCQILEASTTSCEGNVNSNFSEIPKKKPLFTEHQ